MTAAQLVASTIASADDAVVIALPGLTDTVEDFGPARVWSHLATDGFGNYAAASHEPTPALGFSSDEGATWSIETDGVDDGGGTAFVWIAGVCWDVERGRFWALADCDGTFDRSRLYWTTDGTWHPATNGNSFSTFGPSGLFPSREPHGLVALGGQIITGGNPSAGADITALQQCDDPDDGVFSSVGYGVQAVSVSPVHSGIPLPSWMAAAGETVIATNGTNPPRRLNGGAASTTSRTGSAGAKLHSVAGDGAGNWVASGQDSAGFSYAVSTDDGLNWACSTVTLPTVDNTWMVYGAHFDGTLWWFTAAKFSGGTAGMLLSYDLGTDTWTEHTVTGLAAGGYALTGWPPSPRPFVPSVELDLSVGQVLTHGHVPLGFEAGEIFRRASRSHGDTTQADLLWYLDLTPAPVPPHPPNVWTVDIDFECTSTGPRQAFPTPWTVDIDFACYVPPRSKEWRAVIIDVTHKVQAQLPHPKWSTIDETKNDTATTSLQLDPKSVDHAEAMRLLLDVERLPSLEVQIRRGEVIMFEGPIWDTDEDLITQGTLRLADPSSHLEHTVVGELGQPEHLDNAGWAAGLANWRQAALRFTDGLDPVFESLAGEISVGYTVNLPGGGVCVACENGNDESRVVHLFQEFDYTAPPQRDVTFRLSAFALVPSNKLFGIPNIYGPNVKRYGVSLCAVDPVAAEPASYFQGDLQFDVLSGEINPDRWLPQWAELTIPAGKTVHIHAGYSFPQGRSYLAAMHLGSDIGDDFVMADPLRIVQHFVAVYGEQHRIGVDPSMGSPSRVTRAYIHEEHSTILSTIQELARVGYFDWSMRYTGTERRLVTYYPRQGRRRQACDVVVRKDGTANVTGLRRSRMWSRGADGVEAQTSTGQHRYVGAATAPGHRWSEVFSVDREIDPLELPMLARERLAVDLRPETLEFTCLPGDDRFIVGLQKGDIIHVTSWMDTLQVDDFYRVAARSIDPNSDTAHFTLNFEPKP